MKYLRNITIILLFLSAAIPLADAAVGTIYVDVNDASCVGTSGQADPYSVVYCNIQAALDDAADGDVIDIAAGVYSPTATINITVNNVTLKGNQSGADPRPSHGTSRAAGSANESIIDGSGSSLGRIIYIDADGVTLNGLEIKSGTSDMVRQSNSHTGTTVKYCIIHDGRGDEGVQLANCSNGMMEYNYVFDIAWAGDGLNFASSNGCTIQHNDLKNISSDNAAIYVYGSTNTTINDNLISNLPYGEGIKLGAKSGSDAGLTGGTIKNNTIHDVGGGNNDDCIAVYTSHVNVKGNECYANTSENGTIYLAFAISDISITENRVHHNTLKTNKRATAAGILLNSEVDAASVMVNNNNIYMNTPYGLTNEASATLNAQLNYWGDASGPSGAGSGSGDAITSNIIYCPWLNAPYPAGTPVGPGGGAVVNTNTGEAFCSIQAAIDDADTQDGHTLFASAGTYSENVNIHKSLTINGESGTVLQAPVAGGNGFLIHAADISINDFEIKGFANGIRSFGGPANYGALHISGCYVHDCSGVGIVLLYDTFSTVDVVNTQVKDNGGNGIGISNGATISTMLHLKGLSIDSNSQHGLYIASSGTDINELKIEGTTLNGNGFQGIQLQGVTIGAMSLLSGTQIRQNKTGFAVNQSASQLGDVLLKDVTIADNSESGMLLGGGSAANSLTIKECHFHGNAWEEIDLSGGWFGAFSAGSVLIENNIFHNTAWCAIYVGDKFSSGTEPQIHGNDLSSNPWGVFNASSVLLNATKNWWGDICGPLDNSDDSPQPYTCYNPGVSGKQVSNLVIYSPWWDGFPNGQPLGPDQTPVVDFDADVTSGIDELAVQFNNLSENVCEYLWDFGDGTTSTEENPSHVYHNPPQKHYTVSLTGLCDCPWFGDPIVEIKKDFIMVVRASDVNFNAYPIACAPGEDVQFTNNCGGLANHFLWDFGDGETAQFRSEIRSAVDPDHAYAEAGEYSVSLKAWGHGGEDMLMIPDLIYIDPNFAGLNLVDAGETVDNEGWDNAIDHDIISTNADLTAVSGDAWAIFEFADASIKDITKLRLKANNASGSSLTNHLAQNFELLVSTDGVDFAPGFSGSIGSRYGWEVFEFDPLQAKYIKLVLYPRGEDSPFVRLSEVQVFGTTVSNIKARFRASNDGSDITGIPEDYGLSANYPNPFNPETTISYQLPDPSDVTLHVYNVQGQRIATLVNERRDAGSYQVVWNGMNDFGQDVAGGVYIYKIIATNADNEVFTVSRKMTFLK
jgi:PKD repeat protein